MVNPKYIYILEILCFEDNFLHLIFCTVIMRLFIYSRLTEAQKYTTKHPCNMSRGVGRNLYETVCRQMQTN